MNIKHKMFFEKNSKRLVAQNRPQVVLICGGFSSGKTMFLQKFLGENPNHFVLSSEILEHEFSRQREDETHSLAVSQMFACASRGFNVCIELDWDYESVERLILVYREILRSFKKKNYLVRGILLRAPLGIMEKREGLGREQDMLRSHVVVHRFFVESLDLFDQFQLYDTSDGYVEMDPSEILDSYTTMISNPVDQNPE